MTRNDRPLIIVVVVVALLGLLARVYSLGGYAKSGFDEHIYETYVNRLTQGTSYPALVEGYIETQTQVSTAFLPPTRVTFLSSAALIRSMSNISAFAALRAISLTSGILMIFAATAFAWRAAGRRNACGVLALMSAAPLLIHLSHRALIDGFFAFWALLCVWTLWETLRAPRDWRWLAGYGVSLALLVMTKENAAFVFVALLAMIAANRWLHFGTVTSRLLIATLAGPAVGVLVLIALSGGAEPFFHTYLLNIRKSYLLEYAISTGDGPWYRYLLDLVTVSPLTMLLAIAGIFTIARRDSWQWFLALFFLVTYVVMANLRYGMNLRYGAIWDLPLRCFAIFQLASLSLRFAERWRTWILPAMLLIVCAVDLRQYYVLFARGGVYDPVPAALLRAIDMLK